MANQKNKIKVGGLFSGVGGIELGFKQVGSKILWANEVDKYAAQTYRQNFKKCKLYVKDIKEFVVDDVKHLDPVDILVAGFPCQAFSLAGYRKGFKDDRGNLFFDILDVIDNLKKKPKVLFLENVKNFRNHDQGKTFEIVNDALNHKGYSMTARILNTFQHTNVPQNRERTFMICFRNEFGKENRKSSKTFKFRVEFEKIFKIKSNHVPDPFRKFLLNKVPELYYWGKKKPFYEQQLMEEEIRRRDSVYQWRRVYFRRNKKYVCPTLTANMGSGGHNVPIIKTYSRYRKFTPRECFNLQGFPSSTAPNKYSYNGEFIFPKDMSDTQLYKQAGNSVSVPLIRKIAAIIVKKIKI